MTPHEAVAQPVFLARIKRIAARIHACQRVPGRDRKDIAQQIVVVVLQRAPGFDPARGTAEAFVMTAARSAALGILRDAGRAKRDPSRTRPLADAGAVPAPANATEDRDDRRVRVERAVSRLDVSDADAARHLMRFGANNARKGLGSRKQDWSQTTGRIRLTLVEETLGKTSTIPDKRTGDGVSS